MKGVSSIQSMVILMTAVLIAVFIPYAEASAENSSIMPVYPGDCSYHNHAEINLTYNETRDRINPEIPTCYNTTMLNITLSELPHNLSNLSEIHWAKNGGSSWRYRDMLDRTGIVFHSSPSLFGLGAKIGMEKARKYLPRKVGQTTGMGEAYLHAVTGEALRKIVFLFPGNRDDRALPLVTPEQFVATTLLSTVLMAFASVFASGSRQVVIAPLYTRLNREQMLENPTREGIYQMVAQNPGIDLITLKRRLELSNGVLAYHIHALERERYLRSVRDGRYRRFYISGAPVCPGNSIENKILKEIESRPMINQSQLAREMNLTRQAVNYHIRKLVKSGRVVTEKKGRETLIKRKST